MELAVEQGQDSSSCCCCCCFAKGQLVIAAARLVTRSLMVSMHIDWMGATRVQGFG